MNALAESVKAAWSLWMERLGFCPRHSFGLDQLDTSLANHLQYHGGFFVEAGANDGLSQSNTAYFERYLGWRGLLIEPIPELAERCKRNRPRAMVEQCALVARDFPNPTVEMQYCNLMSLVRGARGSFEADAAQLTAGRQYLRLDESPYIVNVQARTLTSVLEAYDIRHIDLLSLDVEGLRHPPLATGQACAAKLACRTRSSTIAS